MQAFTLLIVTYYIYFDQRVNAKTVSGVFSSDSARKGNGQYITKFLFHGGNGLMVYRLEDVSTAVQKEAKLLLFQDMNGARPLSCRDHLAGAQYSITLSAEEHNQSIPHTAASPRAWHVLYADRHTCQQGEIIDNPNGLRFQIMLFNPDASGNPQDHFSAEEAGLHGFFFLLLLAYLVASCIYARALWRALRKGGPMHKALKVLTAAQLLQVVSVFFNYIHLTRYAKNGIGSPHMVTFADFCNMVSQIQMLYMLLSLCMGWSLSRSRMTQNKPLQWDTSPTSTALALGGVATQGALLLWEQFESTSQHKYEGYGSVAGLLLIILRVNLALLFAFSLYQVAVAESSALKRDFYLSFAKGCVLWFLCQPVLLLLSAAFHEHQKQKVVTMGVILCQSISVVVLYRLFLSRSLYWEVSSMSSVSLPLTISRSHRSGF